MPKPTGNPCPVKGCTSHAKPNQLMCWPHWRRVPKPLNHAVFDTYRNLRHDPAAYRQARDAAIAAVEAKEAEERGPDWAEEMIHGEGVGRPLGTFTGSSTAELHAHLQQATGHMLPPLMNVGVSGSTFASALCPHGEGLSVVCRDCDREHREATA